MQMCLPGSNEELALSCDLALVFRANDALTLCACAMLCDLALVFGANDALALCACVLCCECFKPQY